MAGAIRNAAAGALALALTPSPSFSGDLWKGYVYALVIAKEAESACPGAKLNEGKLVFLRGLTVREEDEKAVEMEIVRLKPVIQAGELKNGPIRWCLAASNMFGDRGMIVPGLIDFN